MNIKSYKKFIIISMGIFVILILSACNNSKNDIIISDNIKEEFKKQDKDNLSISKINNSNLGYVRFGPYCWKDDENFVGIYSDDNYEINDIYNVNVKTSKATKVDTLEDVTIFTYMNYEVKNNKLIYSKNNKLWIYDLINNKSKEIWDLTEVQDEMSKYGANISFVKGSDKYISIVTIKKYGKEEFKNIRMLDINTGKVVKSNDMKIPLFKSFMYSKEKDAFYVSKGKNIYEYIYEYNLSNPNEIKKIENTRKDYMYDCMEISDDGKYIYSIVYDKKTNKKHRKSKIVKYDILKNKFTTISDENSGYLFLEFNPKTNIIIYTYVDNEHKKAYTCIGRVKGNKIENTKRVPLEDIGEVKWNTALTMMNEKSTRFTYMVPYQKINDKDNTLRLLLNAYEIKK